SDQVRIDVRGRQGELRAASARRLAARENGEGGAERVEVTEPSIAGGRSLDRLGSEVAARAPGGLHLRGGGGEPEVEQARPKLRLAAFEQHVLGLDVAVCHAGGVQVGKSPPEVAGDHEDAAATFGGGKGGRR